MTDLEKSILEILTSHVGEKNKLTQYRIVDIIDNSGGWGVTCRNVRRIIEDLIKQGYPIVSTPKNGGGYFYQEKAKEGLECARRIRRQAIKLFLKARRIKLNCQIKQLDIFDIRN